MTRDQDRTAAETSSSRRMSTRRILFAAVGVSAAAGALELASLWGHFDYRKLARRLMRPKSYRQSLTRLQDHEQAAGQVIHVGHSTHLLSVAGMRLLTDPWFFDPAFGALSHVVGPAIAPEDVGPLDGILVSHDHADHFDERALDRLDKGAVVVVATERLARRARKLGFGSVHVLGVYEELEIGQATVAAVPGVHDIYEIGFVVRGSGRSIYFAGDTRYQDAFVDIAERYAPQLGILPVDGTKLRGGDVHVMNPEDAVRAAAVLGVSSVMPTHAEAVFSDPLVKHLLATTVADAPAKFGALIASELSAITCHLPLPGEGFALADPKR